MIPEGTIISGIIGGFISKIINDGVDYSKPIIKSVLNDKNNRNLSAKIYRVIEKAFIKATDKNFEGTDKLYDAIEKIFIEFKDHGDALEAVKCGLGLLCSDINDQRCENFLEKFYEGIRQDNDLYKAINIILQQKEIKISYEEFRKLNKKLDNLTEIVSSKNVNEIDLQNRKQKVKSRTQEYADKWNENMFLNDFDKRDQKAGTNVKLREVYLEEHLPNYIWHDNNEIEPSTDLEELLSEYINEKRDSKMLLILGQPGIGKSTLITWITVKFADRINDILVYRFASDLGNVDWKNGRLSNSILEELGLNYSDLNGKTMIIDGFDEVSIDNNRRRAVLDSLYIDWIHNKPIKKFSLIITCRENYVPQFAILKCKFITLQPWNEIQIKSFCNIFQEKTKNSVSESTIKNLIESRGILGIPLILYMVLALNISIEKDGSIVDIYDRIFSLDGGIYDRCINNRNFADKHRIAEIKGQIHQISRDIAIWMFENKAVEAYIPYEEYGKFCDDIMQKDEQSGECIKQDVLIGNYFKKIKHCKGLETEKICFIHRSIYEYFVAETIFSSIENAMIKLTEDSQEELAGKIAIYLKQGLITNTIGEYLRYKLLKLYNNIDIKKREYFYQWWERAVEKMVEHGMFYFTGNIIQVYENVIEKETQCFVNLLKILRLLFDISKRKYILEDVEVNQLEKYIRLRLMDCRIGFICGVENLNLSKTYLVDINLSGVDFDLANLQGANLSGANLTRADFRKTNLREVYLSGANLEEAIFTENQVIYLETDYDLRGTRVEAEGINELLNYEEFCRRRQYVNMDI